MTRNEKREAVGTLQAIMNGAQEQAHSPKLRREMIADHGTPTYTPAAWIAHRMGRRGPDMRPSMPASMIREDKATNKIRAMRRTARRL